MGAHGAPLPAHPDEIRTASEERCDCAFVERAYWKLVSPTTGLAIYLCRYHYRCYQIPLAVDGWSAQELDERIEP